MTLRASDVTRVFGKGPAAVTAVQDVSITLEAGDSWLVPAQTEHNYRILEAFTAVEATAPPAQVHWRRSEKLAVLDIQGDRYAVATG